MPGIESSYSEFWIYFGFSWSSNCSHLWYFPVRGFESHGWFVFVFYYVLVEIALAQDDDRTKRSDLETSEDEKRRPSIRSLRKKATKIKHTLRKRSSKRVAHCLFASISTQDFRDEKEEEAVNAFRQLLIDNDLLPARHDDYHTMLR